jgi:hypothetical protein
VSRRQQSNSKGSATRPRHGQVIRLTEKGLCAAWEFDSTRSATGRAWSSAALFRRLAELVRVLNRYAQKISQSLVVVLLPRGLRLLCRRQLRLRLHWAGRYPTRQHIAMSRGPALVPGYDLFEAPEVALTRA